MSDDLRIGPRVTIPAADLSWKAVRSAGPGGQNVNKLSTKVDLRFDLRQSEALDSATKQRLFLIAKNHLDADGRIIVVCQQTRHQGRNLELARATLAELVLKALERPKPRRPTKPSKSQKRRRLENKRRVGAKKKARSKLDDGD